MNTILMAVDDGITNSNFDVADVMFLLGVIFAGLAGIAYAAGITGTATTTTDQPRPYARFHSWAAAFVAFAVGFIAFGLFLL